MKPYAIISDLHLHNWSAFSSVTSDGTNTRLALLLAEIERAALALRVAGGDLMVVTGDVFHVRGSVAPSVLNQALDTFKRVISTGVTVIILAGNHDLEGKHSTRLGSAITALEQVGCICVSDVPQCYHYGLHDLVLVPWMDSLDELRVTMRDLPNNFPIGKGASSDVLIHAPINDVIPGLPNSGLDANELAAMGYGRIFAGHHHNHVDFGNGVYSVGAIAHHSWCDVGSKAGFLLVWPNEVKWFASHCPSFVELDDSMDETDMRLAADGHYVKARVGTSDLKELAAIRELLLQSGARGVTLIPDPVKKTAEREATSIKQGMTLDQSVASFIDAGNFDRKPELAALCQQILDKARSVE